MEIHNILIVDDNKQSRETLQNYFNKKEGVNLVGITNDSSEAIETIKNNVVDAVIMDIVLSNTDGFSLMEDISKLNSNKKPKILVLSALMQEGFIQKSISLGASYFMAKPFECDLVSKRLFEILETDNNTFGSNIQKVQPKVVKSSACRAIEEKITNIFITVGIPAHIKGYQFLREAIKMAIDQPDIINSITKKLYPSIAERYETTASKVERAIRHAIEVAWNRGKIENINTLFGVKVYANNEKPTNGEFIALVADKMLIEGA